MSASERLHALDAVRGFALLLGVALHGANAYVADFPWIISDDAATSMAVSVYVIHIFRMTLFFLIAGYFAHLAFRRKGQRTFVRDRLMRVGVPLVVGWFVLMPAMGAASVLAAFMTTGSLVPPGPPAEVGTGASPSGGAAWRHGRSAVLGDTCSGERVGRKAVSLSSRLGESFHPPAAPRPR